MKWLFSNSTAPLKTIKFGITLDKSNSPAGYLSANIPNLFGYKLNISYTTKNNFDLSIQDQINKEFNVFKNPLNFPAVQMKAKGMNLKYRNQTMQIENISGYANQNVTNIKLLNKLSYNFKFGNIIGLSTTASINSKKKTFFKPEVELKLRSHIGDTNIFHSFDLGFGCIFGEPTMIDRFFLGSNIGGYKSMSIYPINNDQIGGYSFLESSHKIGFKYQNLEFFLFGDIGFNSIQNNLIETFKSAIIASMCGITTKSLGMSVGIGVITPLKIGDRKLKASVAIPLMKNEETQKLQLGFEADI